MQHAFKVVLMAWHWRILSGLAFAAACAGAHAEIALDPGRVSEVVQKQLESLDVPAASIAVVADGHIVFARAYGTDPVTARPVTADMRFPIGSISKQFCAAAILLLQEDGKLSLDDPAGRYVANLGPATDVTLRQLLSHTGGLRDYWPQDYVFPRMKQPITRQELVSTWAAKPLDFPPGTDRQYSNTGYVVAGMVVEKVSGESLAHFLRHRIFEALHMDSVRDVDAEGLADNDVRAVQRAALGPLRPADLIGRGWLFGAAEFSMTAADLARWDQAMVEERVLSPASWREMHTAMRFQSGWSAQYGLGVGVVTDDLGRRVISHSGGALGFTSRNRVFPESRSAIVVLTNSDAADAAASIADELTPLLFDALEPLDASRREEARQVLERLRKGEIDPGRFTPNALAWFSPQTLRDFAASLTALGPLRSIKLGSRQTRGGMDYREYSVEFDVRKLTLMTRSLPDGRLEQFMLGL
ncbi:MAG: beta-lactamase family protein [Paucibacter sp.]|nr:beta-lactamase family protein [Roseateles sp.]